MSDGLRERLDRWRHELVGGVSAGLAGLPVELNYGLIALAPLGAAFGAAGVTAALHGTVLACLVQVLLRGRPLMILGSRPGVMLIIASLVTMLLTRTDFAPGGVADAPAILSMVLLCVVLAGIFQALFGVLGFGRLIAFVPQPVLSGLSTGIAVSIVLMSLKLALGFAVGTSFLSFVTGLGEARFGSLLVMVAAAWLMFRPPKSVRTVPPVITALVCGMLLHAMLEFVPGLPLSGRAAPPEGGLPAVAWGRVLDAFDPEGLWTRVTIVIPYALTIATLGTIESLLTCNAGDLITGQRGNNDRELLVHGIANVVSGLCGAPTMAGNTSRVVACANSGGRERTATAVYALFVLAALTLVPHWIGMVPQSIISGMLIFFSWGMIDDWQRRVALQAIAGRDRLSRAQWREVRTNAVIVGLVAAVAVAANLMQAVAVGVAAALFIFVRNNARGVVRSSYTGADRHSLKVRNSADAGFLDEQGGRIAVIEAGGALFFGSAERLARDAEDIATGRDTVIIDLRHVTDLDSTGGRILQQLARRLRGRACRIVLSHVAAGSRVREGLDVFGVASAIPTGDWYPDLDSALEVAEDALLATRVGSGAADDTIDLKETDIAYGLDEAGVAALAASMETRHFAHGALLFRQGEPGDSLFVLMHGSVAIRVTLESGDARRITAFGPGVSFGEMALIDRQPRSADAVADGAVEVRELHRAALEQLQREHPAVASRVALNLSRSLSQRLRTTTQDLRAAAER